MLYDHQIDPFENENIAGKTQDQGIVEEHSRLIKAGWKSIEIPAAGFTGDRRN